MRRNRNENNIYKIIVIVIALIAVSFVLFKGCQSIAKDIWYSAADKTTQALGKMSFDALVSHEIYDDFDGKDDGNYIAELVMNQVFPVGELYMQNYVEPAGSDSEPDYVVADKETETVQTETTESGTAESGTAPVENEQPEETGTEPDSEQSTEPAAPKPTVSGEETSTPAQPETSPQPAPNPVDGNASVSGSQILAAAAGLYPADKLLDYDYVINNFFVVPSVTTLRRSVLDLPKIASVDVTIDKNPDVPQILIFHTHSQEGFADAATNPHTIVDAGSRLTKLLRDKYGYNVIHLTDEFDMMEGVLNRETAYTYANARLEQVLAENPSVQVVIDLHRDGVREDLHLVTDINGKQTAKIMLFNGISYTNEQSEIDYLYNPYLTENLTMTYKMYLLGKMSYPDFIRCIYISGYRYCFHHRARSMLIEAGAQTNTYEEVYNAMEPLAELLDKELSMN